MTSMVKNEERFELFPDLPPEIRMMIIDRMKDDVRVKFSFSSKWGHGQASASKYFIYGLELVKLGENYIRIYVIHGKYESDNAKKYGYKFEILEDNGEKQIICQSLKSTTLWKRTLDNSTDIFQYGTNYFKKLLKPRYHTIRKLVIVGRRLADVDFELKNLNSIEDLNIESDIDIRQFFSKISHPLKRLGDCRRITMPFITECEELYQVTHRLDLRDLDITNQQFRRLTASYVHMRIGDLTVQNIYDFVQAWQNEPIRRECGAYTWVLNNQNFNTRSLYRLLGFEDQFRFPEDIPGLPEELEERIRGPNHIPRFTFKNQHDNLMNAELAVLNDVLMFWWDRGSQ